MSTKPKQKRGRKSNNMTLEKRIRDLESAVRVEETKKKYTLFNEVVLQLQSANLPVWTLINELTPGDGANNINGVSYINRGISYKFLIHNTSSEPCIFRMAVIRAKSGQVFDATGPDLFTGTAGLGIDFSSTTEQQRYYYPFNRKKYDIIHEEKVKLGAKNSVYTEQNSSNELIKGYKAFKNRKEFIDSNVGNMNTNYYLIAFCVPSAMDGNTGSLEMTGESVMYYKDN